MLALVSANYHWEKLYLVYVCILVSIRHLSIIKLCEFFIVI